MLIYLVIDLMVLVLAIALGREKTNQFLYPESIIRRNSRLFYIICGFLLFFVSAFRGSFAIDYKNYVDLFYRYSSWTIKQIIMRNWMGYPETGYLIFQYVCRFIFDKPLLVFVLSSFIIVFANIKEISNHFQFGFLAVLLFIEMGNYYSSFNVMRQVFAASIVLFGSIYLYERKIVPFFLFVILASLIHKSALVMIPFYFISNRKTNKFTFIIYGILIVLGFVLLPKMVSFIQRYYWAWYSEEGYGMTGYSFNNLIAPLFIVIIPSVIRICMGYRGGGNGEIDRYNEKTDSIVTVWENSAFAFLFFSLLGTRIQMVQRFSSFFSTYSILYYCYIIKTKIKNSRVIILLIALLLIAFGFFTKVNSAYNPYSFIFSEGI